MKPEPKRRITQAGLGKGPSEPTPPSSRKPFSADEQPESSRKPTHAGLAPAPSSAHSPGSSPGHSGTTPRESGVHGDGPIARQTRDMESIPPSARGRSIQPGAVAPEPEVPTAPAATPQPAAATPAGAAAATPPPAPAVTSASAPAAAAGLVAPAARRLSSERALPRVDPEPSQAARADRGEPGDGVMPSRTLLEVTVVDTARLSDSSRMRAAPARPTPAGAIAPTPGRKSVADAQAPRATPATSGNRPSSNRPARGSVRPPSSRPARVSVRPAAKADKASTVARSRRMSIREDHVGAGLERVPVAVQGPSKVVPRLLLSPAEIAAAPIDHRAGFLVAHIDGVTSVQGLVDIAGMTETEVHEILDRLRRLGIVTIR